MMTPPPALSTPPVPPAPRLDAYQQPAVPESGGVGQAFNAAVDGFGARSAQMQASLHDIVAREAGAPRPSTTGEVAPAAQVPQPGAAQERGGTPGPMALMVDCFNFSIEASLVSRAATQFTGSVSTLMKGQ